MAVAERVVAVVAGGADATALPLFSSGLSQVRVAEVHRADMHNQASVGCNWYTASPRRIAIYVLINVQRNKKIRANQCRNTARTEIPIGGSIRFSNTTVEWRPECSPRQKLHATVTFAEAFLFAKPAALVLGPALPPSSVCVLGSFLAAGDLRAFFRSGTASCVSIAGSSAIELP